MVVDEPLVDDGARSVGGRRAGAPHDAASSAADAFPAASGALRAADLLVLAGLAAVGLVARFLTHSPMWLDEALTINIAKLPVGHIGAALRHDGHPPLYYYLLHYWMQTFGTSNAAVRALAGVFGVVTVPLVWLATRRIAGRTAAWYATAVVLVLPYAVRYSTENRMYSLVMALALGAWMLAQSALERPRPLPLAGLALCTAGLLWSHYWAIWLGAAAALCLLVRLARARRAGEAAEVRAVALVLGALAAGALLFLPWVPSLLYQAKHTGTPWASRSVPTTIAVLSVQDLAGGGKGDQVLLGWSLLMVVLLALFARGRDSTHLELDLHGRADSRPLGLLITLTLAIASAMVVLTNSAFQSRYNAVWVPFFVILIGMGLSRFRGRVGGRVLLAAVVLLAAPSLVRNVASPRSQARQAAQRIAANGRPGDYVALCPDQLGPGLLRELPPGFVVGAFPDFNRDPSRVDWVDYRRRTRSVSPERFAADLLARAGSHQIFLVWSGSYRTHTGLCEAIAHALGRTRGDADTLLTEASKTYEHESVFLFRPAATAR